MARQSRAQSMVELGLLAPVFILVFVLILDVGRAFSAWIALHNAAREGAFFASGRLSGDTTEQAIRDVVAAEPRGVPILADATHVAIAYPTPDAVEVTARSRFVFLVPLVSAVGGGDSLWLSARAASPLVARTPTPLPITPSTPIPSPTPTTTPVPPTSTPTATATAAPTATATPTATPDITPPNASAFVSANRTGGTAGRIEAGDSFTVTMSESTIDLNRILTGWTGASQNVYVHLFNNNANFVGNNDGLVVCKANTTNCTAAGTGIDNILGRINLGATNYRGGGATIVFAATLVWDGTSTFTVTLLAPQISGPGPTTGSSSTGTFLPINGALQAGGIRDLAGNGVTGTPTETAQHF